MDIDNIKKCRYVIYIIPRMENENSFFKDPSAANSSQSAKPIKSIYSIAIQHTNLHVIQADITQIATDYILVLYCKRLRNIYVPHKGYSLPTPLKPAATEYSIH